MKALLLAAGLGTRLRPLTSTVPKCLMPVDGVPILAYHLNALAAAGVADILVNTHYLADQVNAFVATYSAAHRAVRVHTVHEPVLLGSAGTLKQNESFFAGEPVFLVVYADNLTDINYRALYRAHATGDNRVATIAAYYEEHIEQKGAIIHDSSNRIKAFKEKPAPGTVDSQAANAGMYVCSATIFQYIDVPEAGTIQDFGHDTFPRILADGAPLYMYMMQEELLDIGTLLSYAEAQLRAQKMNLIR